MMNERAYTVAEIDALRKACEARWLYGSSVAPTETRFSRSYREDDKTKCVEEIVRTHMIAGHTAQDIYDEDDAPKTRIAF